MIIQLFDNDKNSIIASDGVMRVKKNSDIPHQIVTRNEKMIKNFPHKIAHYWAKSTIGTPKKYEKGFVGKIKPVRDY